MTETAVPPTASVDRMDALKALRESRLAMGSFDFRRAADMLDADDRARLARQRLDVTAELRRLESATLAEIAGALEARREELSAATAETRAALADVRQVRKVLDAVDKLVSTVRQVLGAVA